MQPDHDVALRFLRLLYPEGPWMLTAISTDKKRITSCTFTDPGDDVIDWLTDHGDRNLYYSVNRPMETAYDRRKLHKERIAAVHYLHVDIDPRAGEDITTEQARIRDLLLNYKIEPSLAVFSGGGYNGLWRLKDPPPIGEGAIDDQQALERATDVERRNWQLELDFETPDHCRDINRILRLPGTINWPDKRKKERGRVPALATLEHVSDREYLLSQFGATPVVSVNQTANQATKISVNAVQRIEDIDELDQWTVPERLKVIIAQGHDPTKFDGDRSNPLYYACCELVRCEVPDEIILGIITDSRWGISESVLDKGSQVQRYAIRQLQRAHDHAEDPRLAKMNEQYAVILGYGSKTVVMVERGHLNPRTERWEPIFQSFRSFSDRIKSLPGVEIVQGDRVKSIPIFDWWTKHRRRREFYGVCFEPGLSMDDHYNLWGGFSIQPVSGDRHKRLLDHIQENICDGDSERYHYLIRWMARCVQTPRTQSMVAPVLLSREFGVGKSVFTDFFGKIFEPHLYVASDVSELTGKFNAHLSSSVLVVAEEAFDLRDKRHESVLKERITGRLIGLERKGVDRILVPNYIHLIMTSNKERVIPAGDHERRYFVLRVNPRRMQDADYFLPIIEDSRKGGVAHLLHHLLNEVSLDGFDVTDFPRTDALQEQQEHNLALEAQWLFEKLEVGQWLPGFDWRGPIPKPLLYEDYCSAMSGMNVRFIRSKRAFHRFMMRELPGTESLQIYHKSERPMAFKFPPLQTCRKAFDDNRGWSTEWVTPLDIKKSNVIPMGREPFE